MIQEIGLLTCTRRRSRSKVPEKETLRLCRMQLQIFKEESELMMENCKIISTNLKTDLEDRAKLSITSKEISNR